MCPGFEASACLNFEQEENVLGRISLHGAPTGSRCDPG